MIMQVDNVGTCVVFGTSHPILEKQSSPVFNQIIMKKANLFG